MRDLFVLPSVGLTPIATWACPRCAPLVQDGVFNADFLANLLLLMMPLALIGLIALVVHHWDARP